MANFEERSDLNNYHEHNLVVTGAAPASDETWPQGIREFWGYRCRIFVMSSLRQPERGVSQPTLIRIMTAGGKSCGVS
jgi:hypothetical protein